MAAALKKCFDRHTHFREKISVEEQRAQKDDRFLRGRQIAYLIYDYFRTTGSFDEIQGLLGLFKIRLENDDIQDFDLRWEQALLSASDLSSDKIYCKILLISKQLRHFLFKNLFEKEEDEIITDWECVWDCTLNKLKEVIISGFKTKLQSEEPWPKERDKILSLSGRQENVSVQKQMGHVQKESLVVFHMRLPWETASQHKKKWETQRSKKSNDGGDRKWRSANKRGTQVYVHDLDLFVTVQLLEETPAVLSPGKLCSEHGYSCEWIKRTTPYLLSYQDCHHLPAAARLTHRNQRISQIRFRWIGNLIRSSDDSTYKHACGKLLRKHKGACKSSWSRIGSVKSFTRKIS